MSLGVVYSGSLVTPEKETRNINACDVTYTENGCA
jgi:hypothetical protein